MSIWISMRAAATDYGSVKGTGLPIIRQTFKVVAPRRHCVGGIRPEVNFNQGRIPFPLQCTATELDGTVRWGVNGRKPLLPEPVIANKVALFG